MSQFKDAALGDTVYFWFAANLTTGAAGDGATPLYDVRLAGAAAGAAPVLSGTPTLLTHADYTDGLHEIAVAATEGNGFASGNEYAVFCTLTISTVNPAGFVGSFKLLAAGKTLHAVASALKDKLPSKDFLTGTANSDGDVQMSEATGNFPGTVGKSAATLAAGDVTGNLPANVIQWNTGALPTVGTSTLTAQQVWEYAQRTLTAFGFAVALSSDAQTALVAAIEVELANDATGQALMQAIADKLAAEFDIEDLTIAAIATACRDAILDRVLSGNHDTVGTPGKLLQNADAAITSRLAAAGYTAPDNTTIGTINTAIAHATYGLSALKTLIDTKANAATALTTSDIPTTAQIKTALEAVGSHLALIKTVTDALTAAAAAKLAASAGTIESAAAVAGTLSTTEMTTDLTEATNDHYNGRIIIWTSGVLTNQATDITDYDGATKKLTYTATTEAPTAADTFIIV